jgi:hypothetical protein
MNINIRIDSMRRLASRDANGGSWIVAVTIHFIERFRPQSSSRANR